eukprot:TRINITY_DN8186_c0_g3_i1.p1 TRINITY_DN8186_c0_g3~~TRINITY_DN8186_c0_g3_i1.p1  ORF type:complete len:542 (-),score=79.06 TRINITY_DN8186_c0_g3_i1:92-1717(-)
MSQVKVRVYEAKDLTLVSPEGWWDPYCRITLAGQSVILRHSKYHSPQQKSSSPVWEKTVLFTDLGEERVEKKTRFPGKLRRFSSSKPSGPERLSLLVEMFDTTVTDENPIPIGSVSVPFTNLIRGKEMVEWYPLKSVKSGAVRIGLTAIDFGNIDETLKPKYEPSIKSDKPPMLKHIKQSEALKTKLLYPTKHQAPFREFEPKELRRKTEIGKGTFGIVYKGKIKGASELVVIKDMNVSSHSKIIEEWKKEIELMRFNNCRYVTKVLGFSVNQEKLTIIMEYMKRGSLYDVLYKKPPKSLKFPLLLQFGDKSPVQYIKNLSLVQRLRMARHCVRGLVFLHQNAVVHCDIKSPNILVSKDYTCKLTDFGCAKVIGDVSKDTRGIGSPLWAAPETKLSQYSKLADVYSMGLVLYEIFEAKLPRWNKKHKVAVLPEIFNGQQIILPCVDHNPDKRPSAEQLLGSLDAWVKKILYDVINTLDDKQLKEIGIDANKKEEATVNTLYNYLIAKVDKEMDNLIQHLDVVPPAPDNMSDDESASSPTAV